MADTDFQWTLKAMREAKPRCLELPRSVLERYRERVEPPTVDENNTIATLVDPDSLNIFPYESVGYLYFTTFNSNAQELEKWHGSAFVADLHGAKNVILTAAHNLWDPHGVSEHITFYPGMINRETLRQRYGKFHSVDHRWSHGWDGEKIAGDEATVLSVLQYDIGIVKLAPVKKEDGDGLVNIGDPGVCTPFTIRWMSDEKLRSKWRTLAYPSRDTHPRDCDDNPNLQMMEQTGEYREKTRHNIVKKICCKRRLGYGASGGVWMLEKNNKIVANGVHIASDEED